MATLMLWSAVALIVLAPLVGGIAAAWSARRGAEVAARRFALAGAGLTALCALGARWLLAADVVRPDLFFPLTWLPGAGEIGLRLSAMGLDMALYVSAGLTANLELAYRRKVAPSLKLTLLMLGALAAVNVAFLISSFLGRYVALEIAGLCVALAPLLALRQGSRPAIKVYLLLRLGDAGFLVAALMLLYGAGVLDIDAALLAGATLPAASLTWITGGLLLAAGVKAGVWPFHFWRPVGRRLDLATDAWLYATVMPALGLYLLYRITPLLEVNTLTATLALLWGGGNLIHVLLATVTTAAHFPVGELVGGLALLLAGLGVQPWVRALALVLAPLHWLLAWYAPTPHVSTVAPRSETAEPGLVRFARQLNVTVERGVLERTLEVVPRIVMGVAHWTHRVVEQDYLEGTLRRAVRGGLAAGRQVQRWHTGRLRTNLAWALVMLALALALLFSL